MALKKVLIEQQCVSLGCPVFLVMRDGRILEGFWVKEVLFDLVSLDRPPLEDSEHQGFCFRHGRLRPNWCEGRRRIVCGCFTRAEALLCLRRREIPSEEAP